MKAENELRSFMNALRILRSVDMYEMVQHGLINEGDVNEYNKFANDPYGWAIRRDLDKSRKLWDLIQSRQPDHYKKPSDFTLVTVPAKDDLDEDNRNTMTYIARKLSENFSFIKINSFKNDLGLYCLSIGDFIIRSDVSIAGKHWLLSDNNTKALISVHKTAYEAAQSAFSQTVVAMGVKDPHQPETDLMAQDEPIL